MTSDRQDDELDLDLRAAFARREDHASGSAAAAGFDGAVVARAARGFVGARRAAGIRFDVVLRPTRTVAAALVLGVAAALLVVPLLRTPFTPPERNPSFAASPHLAAAPPRYSELREVRRTRDGELTVVRRTHIASHRIGDLP